MRFLKYQLPVIIYAIGIFIVSSVSIPSDTLPVFPHIDKVFHFLIYCVFAFLISRALRVLKPESPKFPFKITSFTAAFSYGIIIEIYQFFLPARTMELMDIFSNGLGALAGVLFFSKIERFKIKAGKSKWQR
jgi:VanZ family protein